MIYIDGSVTPSTAKLNELRFGKGPGMLTLEEIQLLRKSKKEISEACRRSFECMRNTFSEQTKDF